MPGLFRATSRRFARLALIGGIVVMAVSGASYLAAAGQSDHSEAGASHPAAIEAARDADTHAVPVVAAAQVDAPAPECDPHYPGVCIPPVSYNGDMDCDDLMAESFRVIPPDPHGFDDDNDGIACEPS